MDWFENLMGFEEESPEQVKANISINGNTLTSKVNGQTYQYGALEITSLEKLRKSIELKNYNDTLTVSELVDDVENLHADKKNSEALFQAASQFNLLEMVAPHITPEQGIGRYERDYTQGPACAIACGAGTVYRNYFTPVNDQIGQTANNQINCLEDIAQELNNQELQLWKMSNGYALANPEGLKAITEQLSNLSYEDYELLKGKLKTGIQWDTDVTINNCTHKVSQIYCSALPVAYSHIDSDLWKHFANLILEATYESTLYVGLNNFIKTGNKQVFLTLVGGGAFGNENDWIKQAVVKVLYRFKKTPLEIKIVSYGSSQPIVQEIITKFNTLK